MEVQCPRCESAFVVEDRALEAHRGLVKCSVCGEVFEVPLPTPALVKSLARAERSGGVGRWILLTLIFLLVLVLILQILWWTRSYAYLASSAPVRSVILEAAHALGVSDPWPGPDRSVVISESSTVSPLPDHLVIIRGKLENHSGMVQRYPVIQVVLSNAYGSTIRTLNYTPAQYLPKNVTPGDGFLPGSSVPFVLQGPQLVAAPGYQVTPLVQP